MSNFEFVCSSKKFKNVNGKNVNGFICKKKIMENFETNFRPSIPQVTSCPAGQTLVTVPAGGTNFCTVPSNSANISNPSCPAGTTYSSSSKKCEVAPICPTGQTLQPNGKCISNNACPTGFTYIYNYCGNDNSGGYGSYNGQCASRNLNC